MTENPNTGPLTTAELGRTLARIEEDVREVRSDLKASSSAFVPRGEYNIKTQSLDREIVQMRDELKASVGEIKNELHKMATSRGTWWQVAAPLVSLAMLATTLITLIART